MPMGPVITTPNRLWTAVCREVIIRRPELFKISMLQCIRALFPDSNQNPFLAGFGNRPTDCQSYIAAGVDPSQSYRINPKGEIIVYATNKSYNSYANLEETLHELFPEVVPTITKSIEEPNLPPIPEALKVERISEQDLPEKTLEEKQLEYQMKREDQISRQKKKLQEKIAIVHEYNNVYVDTLPVKETHVVVQYK